MGHYTTNHEIHGGNQDEWNDNNQNHPEPTPLPAFRRPHRSTLSFFSNRESIKRATAGARREQRCVVSRVMSSRNVQVSSTFPSNLLDGVLGLALQALHGEFSRRRTGHGFLSRVEGPRDRITPPCLPGWWCDCLYVLRIKGVTQIYLASRGLSIACCSSAR